MYRISKRFEYAAKIWGREIDKFIESAINSFGSSMFIMGLYYKRPNWAWPRWLRSQLEPGSRGFEPAQLMPFRNVHFKDWGMVGTVQGTNEAMIDPTMLFVTRKNVAFEVWVYDGSRLYMPGLHGSFKQYLERPGYPVIINEWDLGALRVIARSTVANRSGIDVLITDVRLIGLPGNYVIYLVTRPYNVDHIVEVKSAGVEGDGWFITIDGELVLTTDQEPAQFGSYNVNKDASEDAVLGRLNSELYVNDELGWAHAALGFNAVINTYGEWKLRVKAPIDSLRNTPHNRALIKAVDDSDVKAELHNWDSINERVFSISVGDSIIGDVTRQSIANLVMLWDGGRITPGPLIYHIFWVRDGSYMATALTKSNLIDMGKAVVEELLRRIDPSGYFKAVDFELREYDANGQVLWAVSKYVQLAGDYESLKRWYPIIRRGIEWLEANRELTGDESIRGLLPPSWSAEDTGPMDHHYWDDMWAIAGLRELGRVIRGISHEDYDWIERLRREFTDALINSINVVRSRLGIDYMVPAPERVADSAMTRVIAVVWPTMALPLDNPLIRRTLEMTEELYGINGGIVNTHQWGTYGSYLTMNLAHSWAILGDRDRVSRYLTWIINHVSPTYGWAEGISIITERGGQGDAPHGWAAADFIMLIRDLVINDEFETPILLRGMPIELLRRGITASNILTIYGLVKGVNASMKGKEVVINYYGPGKPITDGQYELLIDSPIIPKEVYCDGCKYEVVSSNIIRVIHSGKFNARILSP
ncbi:hypothetical protein VMUT_1968 [Vulcanisaeta moutnovskia 768-28]|uniref:Uncharacterized protein n=1 Tax=Vulcanisaeta moutnovskia (strain 768-28) TaxID=985053 RepID=F0QW74_VULM7|nr:hypothetical protein [Vulcanisaeta moutnovskia]ADY02169.1 hypothetical protein VMUT_1968 [Vulcanisaeta moutnovskia 768-28]